MNTSWISDHLTVSRVEDFNTLFRLSDKKKKAIKNVKGLNVAATKHDLIDIYKTVHPDYCKTHIFILRGGASSKRLNTT